MKETWANILQTRMAVYKEPAPEGLWEGIEAGLAATAITASAAVASKALVHAKHLTHLKWFLVAPVATAAVVTAIVVGYKALFNKPMTPIPPKAPVEMVKQPKADTIQQVVPVQQPAPAETVVVKEPVQVQKSKEDVSQPEPKKEPVKEPEVDNSGETAKQWSDYLVQYDGHNVRKTFSVSAFIGGLPGSAKDPLFENTKYHHKIPLHFGIMLRCDFGNTFGLSTGAVYSILASDISSGTSESGINGKQRLYFIGVPLNVNLNIYRTKTVLVYTSTGVMAEKCFDGQIKRNILYKGQAIGTDIENLDVKPLYWSVNAAAGIRYNLTSNFGFFAEPGVGYHFDNKADVKSVYTDMQLEFNLSLGLVYKFPSR